MKINVIVLLGVTFLTGCAVELAAVSVAAVTAPIWVPIEYSVSQSKIVQPVEVVSASDKRISSPIAESPKAKFKVTKATVVCDGQHEIGKSSSNGIALACNKNLKGRVNFSRFTTRDANLTIGPKSVPEKHVGTLSEIRYSCFGNYTVRKDGFDPFLLTCPEKGAAVISSMKTEKNPDAFRVWINPPQ
jgi:hypothetical protein